MDASEVELERMPAAWSNGADSTQGVRSGRSLLRSVVARLEWKVDREGGAAAFLALETSIRPPCSRTIYQAPASPIPVPPKRPTGASMAATERPC
jgi:hypothetical protein